MDNDNKLIGDFMDIRNTGLSVYAEHAYQYNSSWDWLMPVAKECINPEDNTEGRDNLAVALTTCNIDEVYQAVVEFIKTYNDEEKENTKRVR